MESVKPKMLSTGRSPAKSRKSPKSKDETINGNEMQQAAARMTTVGPCPSHGTQAPGMPIVSPLVFASSQASITHINQLRNRQHNRASLLRRLEDGHDLCNYTHRICLQNKLDGYEHCIRHILYDKNSKFRQCTFVHPQSHKRCPNAARKTDCKESICPWHIKKYYLKRKQMQKVQEEKSNKCTFPQTVFKELEHYCPNEEHEKQRQNDPWTKQEDHSVTPSDYLRRKIIEKTNSLDERESDDEQNNPMVDTCFRSDLIDSDSESIDSDQDEALKNAGVYTAEEVSMILRDKMLRLQQLYMSEFKYLQHLLKEKYKKYLISLRNEREMYRLDSLPFALSKPKEEDKQRLKAMMKYHRHHGTESLIKLQAYEKRKQSANCLAPASPPRPSLPQCIYVKDDVNCENRTLPLSHYCKKHILYDSHQVLFRPCASGNPPCLRTVMSYQKGNTCILHQEQKPNQELVKLLDEENKESAISVEDSEMLQGMEEIASLELDKVEPATLFGLEQFPELDPQPLAR